MNSTKLALRLALLLPPLLLSACSPHPSTPASIVRTERPTLPTLPAELTKAERVTPLAAKPTGDLVTIDKGILGEIVERLAEMAGAIERGNTRSGAVRLWWTCADGVFRTGKAAPSCVSKTP